MAGQQSSPPKTGIRVLIVGAGFAGLTAAIECHRKGHDVTVLEKFPVLKQLGDIISFGPNSSRIFRRWPGVAEQMEPISHRADGILIKDWLGESLYKQSWDGENEAWGVRYDGHRGEFHEIVYRHATQDLGIPVRLGARVEDYFEDESVGGVVLEGGERITADVVLAAEGVRSRGRKIVLGFDDKPKASGYAVYRSWFDTGEIAKDPDLAWLTENGDTHVMWLGPDVHFIAASLKGGKDFSWVCTHKDEQDIQESWQLEAPLSDARAVLRDYDPIVQKILDKTPEPLIDWKLVYRDPLPTWISARRRIVLVGDAAHPFLPTSIQGASQAMEDGATMAVCLARCCGAAATTFSVSVPEAVEAFEALRYERVRSAQRTGEQMRDIWHRADWDSVRRNPESLRVRREGWILGFDAETYAEENWEETVRVLREEGRAAARRLHVPEGRDGYVEFNG